LTRRISTPSSPGLSKLISSENILFIEGGTLNLKWDNLLKKIRQDPENFIYEEGGWRAFFDDSEGEENESDAEDDSEFNSEEEEENEEESEFDESELYDEDEELEDLEEEEDDFEEG